MDRRTHDEIRMGYRPEVDKFFPALAIRSNMIARPLADARVAVVNCHSNLRFCVRVGGLYFSSKAIQTL